jgi:hypothetical protein
LIGGGDRRGIFYLGAMDGGCFTFARKRHGFKESRTGKLKLAKKITKSQGHKKQATQ